MSACLRRPPVAVLLLVTSLARAQEPSELTLHRVQVDGETVTSVQFGSIVTIEGTGLHECPNEAARALRCRHEELSVEVGDGWTTIAACTSRSIVVVLPSRGLGDQQVRVTMRRPKGPLATATLPLNIRPRRANGRTDPWPLPFVIERFELTRAPDGARFIVAGQLGERVNWPVDRDGVFGITLTLGDRVVAQQPLTSFSPGDPFEVAFGPFTRELLAGSYSVHVRYESSKQPQRHARGFERFASAPLCGAALEVETAAEVEAQSARARDHFRALADDLVMVRRELDEPRDPPARQAWLATRLLPELDRVRRAAQVFDETTIVPIVPTAGARLERLIELLLEWSRPEPGTEPTPRIGFDVERRNLLRVIGAED